MNSGPASWSAAVASPVALSRPETQIPLIAEELEEEPAMPSGSRTRRRPRWWTVACLILASAAAGIFARQGYLSQPLLSLQAMGTLQIDTSPQGAIVFVDGVQRGQTPAQISLDPGQHTLEVRAGGESRTLQVSIAAGATASQYLELPKAQVSNGQLQVSTEPSGARVSVDGQPRGTSPVILSDLAPGDHVVTLESDLGSVSQAVRIEAGATASLIVPLAPKGSAASGWLRVSAPADMLLYKRGRLLGSSEIDRIMLPVGKHEIEIVNNALGYQGVRTVNVAPGKTSVVTVELPNGSVSLNATPWASVWIDGKNVGETPIGNLPIRIGNHEVVFRHPQLGEQRRVVTVTLNSPSRLSIDLTK